MTESAHSENRTRQEAASSGIPFTLYASFYDLLYQDKDYPAETRYVAKLISALRGGEPRAISLLDMACGTGRHAMEFRKLGYTVHGSDLSSEMIAIARSRSHDAGLDIEFFNESFQTCRTIGRKYDFVLAMFAALNYLISYEDLSVALHNISSLMHDDGFFIFDCWNGSAVISDYSPVRVKRMRKDEREVIRISETTLDEVTQIATVNFNFILMEEQAVIGEFTEKHQIRYFFLQELSDLLKASGLEVVARHPFLEADRSVTKSDWNVTHIVRKRA